MKRKKRKKKKNKPVKLLEFLAVYFIISLARLMPFGGIRITSNLLGSMLYIASSRRRNIALNNLREAFSNEKDDSEIRKIARESCASFFQTFLEIAKFRSILNNPEAMNILRSKTKDVDKLFKKAKEMHDRENGCIFVTPHIGNWEILPHVSSFVGIPLAIVARPLDNEYLERLVYSDRTASGQILIPKKNALFMLQKTLQKGISIGMLPDQSTMKGLSIKFFGRPALTTPIPALLAVSYRRPLVVVAACRRDNDEFEGFVSDPIMPEADRDEKEEIIRITTEMTRQMEKIIRRYPEQYLWIHNRWKTYKGKKPFLSSANLQTKCQ